MLILINIKTATKVMLLNIPYLYVHYNKSVKHISITIAQQGQAVYM